MSKFSSLKRNSSPVPQDLLPRNARRRIEREENVSGGVQFRDFELVGEFPNTQELRSSIAAEDARATTSRSPAIITPVESMTRPSLRTENVALMEHPDGTHECGQSSSAMAPACLLHSKTTVDIISTAMKRLGLELTYTGSTRHNFARRPGIGIKGKKINLLANYFPIDIPHGEVYHYDVDIEKDLLITEVGGTESKPTRKKYRCQNTKLKRRVIEEMIREVPLFRNIRPAFDGEKNLYTREPLPIKYKTLFTVSITDDFDPEETTTYKITIKPVNMSDTAERSNNNSISLEPLHELLAGKCSDITESIIKGMVAIETILRHGPALHLVPVGRSFFINPHMDEVPLLGGGREIWFGHHQSMRLCQWKPMLNVDKSATTFYRSCSVVEFMFEILYPRTENFELAARQMRCLTDAERTTLTKEMKNLKVEVTHLPYPRKYKIRDITRDNANNIIFMRKINDKETFCSISEYFRSEYQPLKYPNLPCLNVGNNKKDIYLPLEVCNIVAGQHNNKKLTDRQTSDMIRYTARPPAKKFQDIKQTVNAMMQDFQPFSREFGIRVSTDFLKCTGRVLDPPEVMYDGSETVKPSNGSWNMVNKKFHKGVTIGNWMLLSFSENRFCNEAVLRKLVNMLIENGRNVGVDFADPLKVRGFTRIDGKPGDILRQAKKMEPELELAVIVLPAEDIYSEVKTVAETELGLMTQCVKDANLVDGRKFNAQLIRNICQKINAKMGGVNNSLALEYRPQIMKRPAMIVGIDCNHPAPGDKVGYSIAAVVGSLDAYCGKFKASIRVQHKKQKIGGQRFGQDIVVELKEMMKELFKAFYKYTGGKKPQKIIVYRDGVSEGEFQKVMDYEMREIRKACEEMARGETYRPPITFIITGKRHHTRFLPENRRDGVGRPGNVPPGTTVDTAVVHPVLYDFYLCSHIGIHGTSRPAHYTVLWDDNDFTADELQVLTYYLCHTYARCTRSICIPCAVKYADLAASRAKEYLIEKTEGMSSSGSKVSEREKVIIEESIKEAIKVVDEIENRMYFV
ncbi:protein argonaute-2-like isoform X3 [Centruroides sculpturatus]|uniref:protein argonaute-2-like isoform X3 n=1 Tax=Centruroides sculpturatus TaxID=218467 RepID=UPI000C6ED825|nr:protein argonaute-2-like isoform X3 [Centruroides sculpturatus]